eukprot:CAMPEP_0114017326 /NCGR_PEP_ID=MMETSP0372-20130328/14493_1 /TAXON_ID=340204 /ORGANISM="Lankesteria abbotti" /LENGTH=32 /assembly_acc=CAM_ASM_000359
MSHLMDVIDTIIDDTIIVNMVVTLEMDNIAVV